MNKSLKKWIVWAAWGAGSIVLALWLSLTLVGANKTIYLPGHTTDGHYQIEIACDACHASSFGGTAVLQDACMNCHGAELAAVDDSHPRSKFTDPRNADRVSHLDARVCITCHREHQQDSTGPMGVTVPGDFCVRCHENVAEERASHKNLGFDSCASSGCHNFHDNQALYEDFLVKHAAEPAQLDRQQVLPRDLGEWWGLTHGGKRKPLTLSGQDAPSPHNHASSETGEWLTSAHARGGVNCSDCHMRDASGGVTAWQDKPGTAPCAACHETESTGFARGKHGMRLDRNLPPMMPSLARLPMREKVSHEALSCTSCHGPHEPDTRRAAMQACIGCHNDEHTRAYGRSPHGRLWQQVLDGKRPADQGVSCASCHMPRLPGKPKGIERIVVQHNQNDNLRPNEKMIRSVCMACHGLGFAIDALADAELVRRSFTGKPKQHIKSIDWAAARVRQVTPADASQWLASDSTTP